jgi:mono/diheme cytochrome c family protein
MLVAMSMLFRFTRLGCVPFGVMLLALLLSSSIVAAPAASTASEIDFVTQVQPILETHCLRCHSDDTAQGDLSLATWEAVQASGAVEAGEPDSSYLIDLITSHDGKPAQMPKESPPLSTEQVATLRTWIEQGATWPAEVQLHAPDLADHQWWSLQPIVASTPPGTAQTHPVDAFVDAKLTELGLTPVPSATPDTLIRRLSYDLTGLPPQPADVQTFLTAWKVNSEQAWTELVDRLLESPAFGEKWGQHWLDVARYAETHGYDKDQPRPNAWPYRDYVIRSFNHDKPYGRFVQEQVAGDAIFPNEPDGVLGLGFLAAGPWDFIGHWEVGESKLDGRIAKHLDRDEMVGTVFNVFMSTTVQCAQCHQHKFDPIRMEDYYQLHATLSAVDRAERRYQGLSVEQQTQQQALHATLQQTQQRRDGLKREIEQQIAAEAQVIDQGIAELTEGEPREPQPQYGFHSQISNSPTNAKWVQVDLGEPRTVSEVRLLPAFDNFNNIGAGFGFPVQYTVQAANEPNFQDEGVQTWLDATGQDHPNPQLRPIAIKGTATPVRYIRVTATRLAERQADYIFALAELQAWDEAGHNQALHAPVTALDSIEAPVRWSASNLTDGVYFQAVRDPQKLDEYYRLQAQRQAIELAHFTPEINQTLAAQAQEISQLQQQLDAFPRGDFVYAAATSFPGGGQFVATGGKPREIHLLHRGDLRSPGERMLPGAPPLWPEAERAFAKSEAWQEAEGWQEAEARAALAKYLTDPSNPLTWRTMANRVWQWTFGQPLVGTPNDFGRMGMSPSHPELLDYLAVRLRDDPGQSIKSLVRLLVTSQAYRRASGFDAANANIDAGNKYLWRGQRRRLTAEEFRDSIMAVSGVLQVEARGGPSFRDFIVEKPEHSPHYQYHLHDPHDPATHRRSIYRFVVRSQPQPMLTALDCADPSISVPMRDESTTALQALTQWNNRSVEAMSQRFAERLQREANGAEKQIELGCQLALGRPPTASEQRVLRQLLSDHGAETLARVLLNTSAFTYVE